jgi:hypothetical protein
MMTRHPAGRVTNVYSAQAEAPFTATIEQS